MTLYIFDTDHLSLYGRNHPILIQKLLTNNVQLVTTAISVEESFRGRLAQVAEAKNSKKESNAYQRLIQTVQLLSEFQILPYDQKSINHRRCRIRGKCLSFGFRSKIS